MPNTALDYAMPAKRAKRHRLGVVLLGLVSLPIVIVGWQLWGGSIRATYLEWARVRANARQLARCAAYVAPLDQVVYEESPGTAKRLLSGSDWSAINVRMTTQTNSLTSADFPFTWQRPVVCAPPLWRALANRLAVDQSPDQIALLFMHERTSPDGTRWLVCIGADCEVRQEGYNPFEPQGKWGMVRNIRAWTHRPDPAYLPNDSYFSVSDLQIVTGSTPEDITFSENFSNGLSAPFPLRFFAGQADPNDSSRFTIRYQLDGIGHEGILTGWLVEDGNVKFSVDAGAIEGGAWSVPTTRPTRNETAGSR